MDVLEKWKTGELGRKESNLQVPVPKTGDCTIRLLPRIEELSITYDTRPLKRVNIDRHFQAKLFSGRSIFASQLLY